MTTKLTLDRAPGRAAVVSAGPLAAICVALLGTLVGHRGGFVAGMHVSAAVSGAAFLAGCGLTAVTVDRRREGRRPAT
jgi:hypothetical protein